ncbi:MAG: gliding motility-associated C-terminal domain-containing protein [Bacteroidales bacterium]|nr:gliding motility-associated C-terminal domain-containing protein [Bacteroidales bacterium]
MKLNNNENDKIKQAFDGYEVPKDYFDFLEKNILNKTINKRKIISDKILTTALLAISVIILSIIMYINKVNTTQVFEYANNNYHLSILSNDSNLYVLDNADKILYLNIDSNETAIINVINKLNIPEKEKNSLKLDYRLLKYNLVANNQPDIIDTVKTDKNNITINDKSDTTLFMPREICSEKPILLGPSIPNQEQYKFKWSNGETSNKIYISESGTYSLTITPINSQTSKSLYATTKVNILPPPTGLSSKNISGCVGSEISLSVDVDTTKYQIKWMNNNKTSKSINVSKAGTYIAKIIGCETYLDTFIVSFSHCDIIIPNAITPNGDGINDVFEIKNIENYPNTQLYIYANDGKLIYQSKNYKNDWDASTVRAGTYMYKIIFPDKISQSGTLLIIK